MARKKKADNPELSQETPAVRESTDLHVPEAGLMEESPSKNNQENDSEVPVFKDEARAAIFARRKEQIDRENGIEPGTLSTEQIIDSAAVDAPQESVQAIEGVTPPPAQPEVEDETPAAAEISSEEQKKYKFNADGQSFECTPEELIQMAQRGVGAGRKFQEAAEKERHAEAMALMFSQQNSQPQGAGNNQTAQQQPPEVDDSRLRDIAKRLNYGSEEEQVKALKEAGTLFGNAMGKTNQQLNPEAIIDVATRNALNVLTAQQEQEILKNDFKDIISDPAIAHATDFMANQLANKYAALGQQKTRLDLLREAGGMARERYLKPAAASNQPNSSANPTPTVVDMTNKIERKRAAPQPPASANKVASSGDSQSYGVPASQALEAARSKAFADIARRRGQPVQ